MLISDPIDDLQPLQPQGKHRSMPERQFMSLLEQSSDKSAKASHSYDSMAGIMPKAVELDTDSWLELFAEQKLQGANFYPADLNGKSLHVNAPVSQNIDSIAIALVTNSHRVIADKGDEQFPDKCLDHISQNSDLTVNSQIINPHKGEPDKLKEQSTNGVTDNALKVFDSFVKTPVLKPREGKISNLNELSFNDFYDSNSSALIKLADGCTLLWSTHASGDFGFQNSQPFANPAKYFNTIFIPETVLTAAPKSTTAALTFKVTNSSFLAITQQQNELSQLIEEQVDASFQTEAEVDVFMRSSWTAEFQQKEYQREHWFFDQQSDESATLYYRNYFQQSAELTGAFSFQISSFSQAQQFMFNGNIYAAGELNAG